MVRCPYDKDPDMAMVFELVTILAMLALGFVLGRIWEIRQEIRRNQQITNGRVDGALAGQIQTGYRVPTASL